MDFPFFIINNFFKPFYFIIIPLIFIIITLLYSIQIQFQISQFDRTSLFSNYQLENQQQMLSSNKKQNIKDAGSQKIIQMFNGPTQKTFMKYYEQNIRLKKQLEQKNTYINQLKKKIQNQMNLNKTTNPYAELNQLKQQVKKPGPVRAQSSNKKGVNTFYNTSTKSGQTKKVQNLLEIIQHYKSKLLLAQEQCANMRRQKVLLQQDLHIKQKVQRDFSVDPNSKVHQLRKQEELLFKLKQKISEYELEKQRNTFMQAQMKRLQAKIRTLEFNQDEIQQLKVQNRIWEQRVMRLTMMNDTTQGGDIRATQQKNRQLQLKLKNGMDKYAKLKQENMKLSVDNQLQNNKLIQLQYANQQLQKQNLVLKKNEINDPIIQKLITNKDLLVKVVGQLQKPKSVLGQQTLNPHQTAQKLIFQKQQLARELIQAKNKIKLMEENWRQKQALNTIQRQELINRVSLLPVSNNNATYTSKQGIPYDGDISMFNDEKISIAPGINYFDIYLGQINLTETIVKSVANISTGSNPLIMATVDFYNFNTQNTKLIQGLVSNLNSQFTFKIVEDEFFYKYLNKGSFKIDIWASQGNKNHHLGVVQISLKQLFMKNKPNVAPVINSSAPIILSQKVIGTIHFDIRMRLPIYQQTSKILQTAFVSGDKDQKSTKRKLIVQIQQGSGFSNSSNLFVYYSFRLEDYYTKTSKGPQPKWSHYKMLDLNYNQQIKNYLKKNQIEFTIFDDNAVLYDEKDNDVVGSGSIPLLSLVDVASSQKPIRQKLQIKKNGVKMGSINVKIFWYETKQKVQTKQIKRKQDIMTQLHNDILNYIADRNSSPENQFRRIDNNGTGMISYDEFNMWVTKVKQSNKYSQQILSKYYDTFKQPLNLLNWIDRFKQKSQEEKRPEDLMQQLGMINQILRKNSVQIRNQVSLRQFLKDKKLLDVTLEIDQDNNGKISKKQLMKYMKEHNIILDQNEIQSQEIKLVEFLKKYTTQ